MRTDLRLNNWVKLCFENREGWFNARVTAIHSDGTIDTDTTDNPSSDKYYFEPIQLTETILESLGFEKTTVTTVDTWQPNGHTIRYYHYAMSDLKTLQIRVQELDDNIRFVFENPLGGYIKYVHQLQNLVFALSEEEFVNLI